jgi:transposase-like protein
VPRNKRPRGRPTLLTPDREQRILDLVQAGNHITTACAHVGIHHGTLYRWLDKADEAEYEAEQSGQPIPDRKRVYVEFRDRLALARALAEEKAIGVVWSAMEGGHILSEEPILNVDGEPQRDDRGEILYRRTFSAPDGRLAMTYLARSAPGRWGQNAVSRLEISGPGGGPVESGPAPDQIDRMAARMAEVLAARQADAAAESVGELEAGGGEYEDAEVVPEYERNSGE